MDKFEKIAEIISTCLMIIITIIGILAGLAFLILECWAVKFWIWG